MPQLTRWGFDRASCRAKAPRRLVRVVMRPRACGQSIVAQDTNTDIVAGFSTADQAGRCEGSAPAGSRGPATKRHEPANAGRLPISSSRARDPRPDVAAEPTPEERFVAAMRRQARKREAERAARIDRAPIERATSREGCALCGVPGFRGCAHQLPYEAPGDIAFKRGNQSARMTQVMA